MPITKRQLAASLRVCSHIADREAIASFLVDEPTEGSVNPFWQTSAGAQRQTWSGQSFEFRSSRIESLGLGCLLKSLCALACEEPLVQEIFRSGPFRAYVYHRGDGCQIIGAVLHGGADMALPAVKHRALTKASRRLMQARSLQLDLFAIA